MKHFFTFASCVLAFLLIGCSPNIPYQPSTGGGSSDKKTYLTTGETSDVTHNSAVLYAQTNLEVTKYELISYGFMYAANQESVEEHEGLIVWSEDEIENEMYSATVTDLEADQDYYYCAVVLLNGEDWKYGEINEFHTEPAPEDSNTLPMIESPGYGKVTIAVRAPEGTCNGMVAVGAATNWDGSDDWEPSAQDKKFTKIDGEENWYQITLPANYGMNVKVIAVTMYDIADWSTQWGMNVDGEEPNVILLEGEGYLDNMEYGGEVRLMELVENTVVYVDVLAWQSDPCVEKNQGGWATFRVTVPDNTPIDALVSVAGSFYEDAWNPGAYVLTRLSDGSYYGEFDVPEGFEYKYVLGYADLWSWDYVETGGNRQMPLDLHAQDVVEAWNMIPENPNQGGTGWENGYEWVDLGLPSGLKWATCNVGANKPEDYGDYFAWGETQPKDYYDWSTYKWCNGSEYSLTKYCDNSYYGYNDFTDYKTTLDWSDDAANYNWGGSWRMPTKAEQDELRNNCTWTWTTQNGVNGYKVTSKSNVNSIFLPAAGFRRGSSLNNAGSYGYFWSSSLTSGDPYFAYGLAFDSSLVGWYYNNRCYGLSVRPVCP